MENICSTVTLGLHQHPLQHSEGLGKALMALQFVSHKFSSLIFCEYLNTSAHKSWIVSFSSRSTVLEVCCYSMFATDTPQIGSRRLYPLRRASYFSWLTLVLPAQLRLVPWKCHPLFSHLGASSSVAASCCVSASPSPLVVDDPVYLGCVYTVWKCFAPNNQWCGLRNIFTRYCWPSTSMLLQERPLVPREDLPPFLTEHPSCLHSVVLQQLLVLQVQLWPLAGFSVIYIYIFIYIYICQWAQCTLIIYWLIDILNIKSCSLTYTHTLIYVHHMCTI